MKRLSYLASLFILLSSCLCLTFLQEVVYGYIIITLLNVLTGLTAASYALNLQAGSNLSSADNLI